MIDKISRWVQRPSAEDVKCVDDIEAARRYQDMMADASKPLAGR